MRYLVFGTWYLVFEWIISFPFPLDNLPMRTQLGCGIKCTAFSSFFHFWALVTSPINSDLCDLLDLSVILYMIS